MLCLISKNIKENKKLKKNKFLMLGFYKNTKKNQI